MNRNSRIWIHLLIIAGILPVTAAASTVYSDLASTSPTYNATNGNGVSGSSSLPGYKGEAWTFTPSGPLPFLFTQLEVALEYLGGTNQVDVFLTADLSGVPDTAAPLESWSVSGLPSAPGCCTLQTLTYASGTASGPIMLSPGTPYWLAVEPSASDTWTTWNLNDTGATGAMAQDSGSGFVSNGFATEDAFAVEGTATAPEPASWQYVGLVFAFAFIARATRRPDGVPEQRL